jgi:hypothetical protein
MMALLKTLEAWFMNHGEWNKKNLQQQSTELCFLQREYRMPLKAGVLRLDFRLLFLLDGSWLISSLGGWQLAD